ncbi:MAG: hypothetical protein BIFFINMI_02897 [Phycisphaerae bacterium]|nr:hypothetical protein [Phycisphaerae bacterium]
MTHIRLEQPGWAIAAAVAVAAAVLMAAWTRRRRQPNALSLLLRGLIVALVLSAVARPTWIGRGGPGRVYVLLDRSASMPDGWAAAVLQQLQQPRRLGNAQVVLLPFPGSAQPPRHDGGAAIAPADPADGSDPAAALSAPLARGDRAPILMLTDGAWTAPPSWPTGRETWALCPPRGRANVGLTDLAAAVTGSDGRMRLAVRAVVAATRSGPARVAVLLPGTAGNAWTEAVSEELDLLPGQLRPVTWLLPLETPAAREALAVRVTVAADWDELPGDNAMTALACSDAAGRRCLLVTDSPGGATDAALAAAAGWSRAVHRPQGLAASGLVEALGPTDVIVLDDVAADDLGESGRDALVGHLRRGGGLIAVGGPHALGLGDYDRTGLDRLLPVRSRPRNRPPAAIVLILDRSGSMSEPPDTPTTAPAGERSAASKLDLLKQAVGALGDLFIASDRLAVIGFADQTRTFYASPADGPVDWRQVRRALLDMQAAGGTEVGPALRNAAAWLAGVDVPRKHVLLLTDGKFNDVTLAQAREILKSAGEGVTVSTFAATRQAAEGFLPELARQMNGRYYGPGDWGLLGQRFHDDLTGAMAQPTADGPLNVIAAGGWAALPAVERVLTSELREGAQLWYQAQSPGGGAAWPLVAVGPVSAGRSAIVTTTPADGWAANWRGQAAADLLARLLADVAGRDDPRFALTVSPGEAGALSLELEVRSADATAAPINLLALTAQIDDAAGHREESALLQVAPGRYAATVVAGGPRTLLILEGVGPDRRLVLRRTLGPPVEAEYARLTPQPATLDALCRAHGGRLLDSLDELPALRPAPTPAATALWPVLLLAAAVALLADVVVSRPAAGNA